MNSPITGKPMKFEYKEDRVDYRNVSCLYIRCCWKDKDTFTTTEMDEYHLKAIHEYWELTRTPRKEKTKVEKLLLDELNKYRSWYQQQTVKKLGKTPNFKYETELLAKIELLKDLQKKLYQNKNY